MKTSPRILPHLFLVHFPADASIPRETSASAAAVPKCHCPEGVNPCQLLLRGDTNTAGDTQDGRGSAWHRVAAAHGVPEHPVVRGVPARPQCPRPSPAPSFTLVGAAAQSQDISCDTAWEGVKRGAEATKMHQKHPGKAVWALKRPCNVTEHWGRRMARIRMG